MNDVVSVEQHELTVLDRLTQEARNYAENAATNMIQLGRTLYQAKPHVPYGGWEKWITEEVQIDVRWAQICMACYTRYQTNPEYAKLGKAKMQIMLSLPLPLEEGFMQENDVEAMTTRELREAVKRAREEAKAEADAAAKAQIAEIERERDAVIREAEARASQKQEIPEDIANELRQKERQIESLTQQATEAIKTANELRRQNFDLKRDNDETEALIQSTQALNDELQQKIRDYQRAAQTNEDDAPAQSEFSLDSFNAAVGEFMRTCARLPYMRNAFSVMDHRQRAGYEEVLRIVEGWCASCREAMESGTLGGIVIE